MVPRPVALVQSLQMGTGKCLALVAVLDAAVLERGATSPDVGASLVSGLTPWAIGHPDLLSLDIVLQREVHAANSAVHSARGD